MQGEHKVDELPLITYILNKSNKVVHVMFDWKENFEGDAFELHHSLEDEPRSGVVRDLLTLKPGQSSTHAIELFTTQKRKPLKIDVLSTPRHYEILVCESTGGNRVELRENGKVLDYVAYKRGISLGLTVRPDYNICFTQNAAALNSAFGRS
jgi:hypothetical protein